MRKLIFALCLLALPSFAQNTRSYMLGQDSNGNWTPVAVDTTGAFMNTSISAFTDGQSTVNTLGRTYGSAGSKPFLGNIPMWFNGVTIDRSYYCASSAVVNVTNGTTGQLVALTASQTIRVCNIVLTSTAATTATLSYGTGTTCGTGNTALTGAMALGASTSPLTIHLDPDGALRTASGNALCLAAGATTVTGFITYSQF